MPQMKTFSQGDINAPFFSGVGSSIEDFDLTFHDDLNTTIKNLYHKQVRNSFWKIELLYVYKLNATLIGLSILQICCILCLKHIYA